MRQRQLITFGCDDGFAQSLHERVQAHGIVLRKTRQADACMNLLRQGTIGAVVLRVGRDLECEFGLLARITQQFPQVDVVVLGEVDHPPLATLAWDLGASCVLIGPEDVEPLFDVVAKIFADV